MKSHHLRRQSDCIVFAYRFLPYWSVGAKRNLAYVNALSDIYRNVYVFTGRQIKWPKVSKEIVSRNVSIVVLPTLESLAPRNTLGGDIMPPRENSAYESIGPRRSFRKALVTQLVSTYKIVNLFAWAFLASLVSVLLRAKPGVNIKESFALTMPWECFIPSRINQLLFSTPYYLDIRDAWTGNPSRRSESSWALSRIESHALRHASWVSLVTEALYQICYKSLGKQYSKNASIIPNNITKLDVDFSAYEAKGCLPKEAVNFLNSSSGLVLGYTGRMNEKAIEAADYFHACKSLTDEVVSLIAAGDCRDYFENQSTYYSDCILLGPVNYFQSRSVQLLADFLVVFLGQDYGVKPVKISEYLLADSPILIVGSTPCGIELENLILNNQYCITWLDMRTSVSTSSSILSEFFQEVFQKKKIKITNATANRRQVIHGNLLENDLSDALSLHLL